jgi:predicted TIM-barrel fold metal-dependent hydrolase
MRPVGEVEFVAGIAAMSASGGYGPIKVAQGIVGYADLALGDRVEPVLEALIRAGGGRLAGVRYSVGYDADPTIGNSRPDSAPHMYARPEIRAAVARLATHGLALDAWCYHPQLADVIALARAVPQATIVMCHVGGVLGYGAYAGKKDEVHAAWRASMAELATCPNVSVKLGGMLNRGAALNFRELPVPPNSEAWAAAWRPYVEPCIELFGADRCNFESNFPVDKMGTGYAVLWNAFKRITARCSQTEKLALYSGTAKRLYHLD